MSPQELEKMPKEFEKIMQQLEDRVMADIVRRVKINSEITRSADWQIYRLERLGKGKEQIKEYIQEALALSEKQIDELYDKAFEEEYVRNKEIYKIKDVDFIPFSQNEELKQLIGAMIIQTKEELHNISQSIGFIKMQNGKRVFTPLAQYYQDTLDNAIMDITTGVFDYNTVLKRTINELTNSGLRSIEFASGRSYRVDSAVRTAVMTGISQITGHISEQNAKDLGTEYFEVTAHGTARPSHQVWQGKVFTMQQLKDVCGYGSVTGLKGANCYHDFYPFFPGISERAYADEELKEWAERENTPKEYNGKEYTTYEASQKQRKMELLMRKQRQDIKLLQEGGANEEDIIEAKSRYRATMTEYVEFSKKMGLPQQMERVYGTSSKISIAKNDTSDIINSRKMAKEVEKLKYIGKLDRDKLGEYRDKIITDEVVLTDERLNEHILIYHPKEYEQLKESISEIIEDPDYILRDNRHDDTIILLKHIKDIDKRGRIVVKLALGLDEKHPKNSIITLMKLNERTWTQTLKNRGEIIFDKKE